VVHISVGSFHRSHQAVYLDDLARRGERDWGIVGVGLRRPELREVLSHQDGLYTVVARGAGEDEASVVGALTRYLFAPEDGAAALEALADEHTALVTLTITGTPTRYDLARGNSPAPLTSPAVDSAAPLSALGYIVEALDRRRRAGRAPFTVLSCDNLPDNGAVARMAVVSSARLRDERLGDWIEEHVEFPNSMVDRITPKTTVADREEVARDFGVLDRWPVITEPFSQWVLEDRFCNRRPPLDEVGVQFVDDVAPYALMKTRLLNASHCAIGFLGSLAGLRRADEVMGEPVFRAYVERLMDEEVTPLLPPVPGIDLSSYKGLLLERLANPKMADDLHRLCRAGSSKVPSHVLSSIAQARERGSDDRLLTLAVAGWFRYLRGTDERGRPVPLDDPLAARLRALALAGGTDPRPLLGQRALFGELGDDPAFVESLEESLLALELCGVRAAVDGCLAAEPSLAA
jgi:fructuronate reductase/mannitol 2-dehydrogenase